MSKGTIPAYCVQWQSEAMPAPAFWYFADEAAAERAFREFLQPGYKVTSPRACRVPVDTPLLTGRTS